MDRRTIVARAWVVLLVLGLLGSSACGAVGEVARTVELGGPTMGTTWSVRIVTGTEEMTQAERLELGASIRDLLARINALMSTWDPESELSRFNRFRELAPFPVAPETFEVLRWAVQLAEQTGGALDVTLAPLVEAWGFGAAEGEPSVPDEATLARLRDATGIRHLALDPDGRWVRKRRPDVECDLSALAPGYAADRIAALLEARGFGDFLIDVGGELVARGRNDAGRPWQIAIERPLAGARAVARLVPLSDTAIATSGDYRNYREVSGERLSHILDPATGRPIRHGLASVTVLDSQAVRADGLATALVVLGPERGMELARELDLAALFMVRTAEGEFDERATPRFEALAKE